MGLLQFVQKEKAHQHVQLPQDPQVSQIHNDTSYGRAVSPDVLGTYIMI